MVAWTRFPPPRWHSAGLFILVIYGLGAENVSCVRVLMVPASPFSLVFPVDTSLVWYLTLLFSIWFFFSVLGEIPMSLCITPLMNLTIVC